jgi:hypothetical protein
MELRVIPSDYAIQTHDSPRDSAHLKSWVIDGSIDGMNWIELDRRTNNSHLNGSHLIRSFSISKSIECRFIRVRQTGKNHQTNDRLKFYHFEVFGALLECAATCPSSVEPIRPLSPSTPPSSPRIAIDHAITEIVMNSIRPLDGILSHLSRKHGGNVHDTGIVTITSSSIYNDNPHYSVNHLARQDARLIFCSKNEVNQWVQWDFHELRVNPEHYSIQTQGFPQCNCHLKSWVIEGSIDGLSWTELDRRTDNNDLNERLAVHSFSISKPIECRFIRLRQTGRNHAKSRLLAFYHFEVFGSLRECG